VGVPFPSLLLFVWNFLLREKFGPDFVDRFLNAFEFNGQRMELSGMFWSFEIQI
jgi:hypothetical protein